jgi:hypothetical protein
MVWHRGGVLAESKAFVAVWCARMLYIEGVLDGAVSFVINSRRLGIALSEVSLLPIQPCVHLTKEHMYGSAPLLNSSSRTH